MKDFILLKRQTKIFPRSRCSHAPVALTFRVVHSNEMMMMERIQDETRSLQTETPSPSWTSHYPPTVQVYLENYSNTYPVVIVVKFKYFILFQSYGINKSIKVRHEVPQFLPKENGYMTVAVGCN